MREPLCACRVSADQEDSGRDEKLTVNALASVRGWQCQQRCVQCVGMFYLIKLGCLLASEPRVSAAVRVHLRRESK